MYVVKASMTNINDGNVNKVWENWQTNDIPEPKEEEYSPDASKMSVKAKPYKSNSKASIASKSSRKSIKSKSKNLPSGTPKASKSNISDTDFKDPPQNLPENQGSNDDEAKSDFVTVGNKPSSASKASLSKSRKTIQKSHMLLN